MVASLFKKALSHNLGYGVTKQVIDKKTGKIVSSNKILKILKKRKQNTKISGFIMGSGKIYAVTLNGFLISEFKNKKPIKN